MIIIRELKFHIVEREGIGSRIIGDETGFENTSEVRTCDKCGLFLVKRYACYGNRIILGNRSFFEGSNEGFIFRADCE